MTRWIEVHRREPDPNVDPSYLSDPNSNDGFMLYVNTSFKALKKVCDRGDVYYARISCGSGGRWKRSRWMHSTETVFTPDGHPSGYRYSQQLWMEITTNNTLSATLHKTLDTLRFEVSLFFGEKDG